jgi:hypothetical protein
MAIPNSGTSTVGPVTSCDFGRVREHELVATKPSDRTILTIAPFIVRAKTFTNPVCRIADPQQALDMLRKKLM